MSFHRFSKHRCGLALNAVLRSDNGDTRIIHDQTLSAFDIAATAGISAYLDDYVLLRLQGFLK
jgi:hypothetical protein